MINLSVDKPAEFRGAHRLLKPGGESISPTFIATAAFPMIRADPVLYGECLGGALYWNDFLPIAKQAFLDPRLVTNRPIAITHEAVKQKLGSAKFFSATYRLFKLDGLETACAVIYKGSMAEQPDAFELDGHHLIERGGVFRYAATLGACSPIRGFASISISSATSPPTTGSSQVAAHRSPSPQAKHRKQAAEGVAEVRPTSRQGGSWNSSTSRAA
ncbi:MAG: hypothetical protein WBE50_14005 [Methyloceanibacter sp.]